MAASFTLPTVLANLAAGNQALSLIDGDLTTLRDPLLSLNTFSNFYTDTGAANAYVITVTTPQVVTQSAGLRVQFLATNANTGASTLQINALSAKNIKNLNGTALAANQILANAIVDVMYDGTQYLLLQNAFPAFSQVTNSLSGDVALNNAANYFDGPSVAQGTAGTWLASGTVTVDDTAGAAQIFVKLWDGTTVIASAVSFVQSVGRQTPLSLSGFLAAPAGNLRISVKSNSVSGLIRFNSSGNSKDSTVSAIRIA